MLHLFYALVLKDSAELLENSAELMVIRALSPCVFFRRLVSMGPVKACNACYHFVSSL